MKAIVTKKSFKKFYKKLIKQKVFVCDTETASGLKRFGAVLSGMVFSWGVENTWVIPLLFNGVKTELTIDYLRPYLIKLFANPKIRVIMHNVKFDMHIFICSGIIIKCKLFDTASAAFLVDENRKVGLKSLVKEEFGEERPDLKELFKKYKVKNIIDLPPKVTLKYTGLDGIDTWRLYKLYKPQLKDLGLNWYFYKVEMPLLKVLFKMERRGIRVDREKLLKMKKVAEKTADKLEKKIYKELGCVINLRSHVQLREILYDKMGLGKYATKTPKDELSTDEESLTNIAKAGYKIGKLMILYRTNEKVLSTYIGKVNRGLLPKIRKGKLHTNFNTTVAVTNRLSSSGPNLQNITRPTDYNDMDMISKLKTSILSKYNIRECFIAPKGYKLLVYDYSQLEFRIMVIYSKDKKAIDVYKSGADMHVQTAIDIYSILLNKQLTADDITKEMRRDSKTCNFALIYGAYYYRLMELLGMVDRQAKLTYNAYHKSKPFIKRLSEETVQKAIKNDPSYPYIRLFWGMGPYRRVRKLLLPKYISKQDEHGRFYKGLNGKRSNADRQIFNALIQGTGSVMTKLAQIYCEKKLKHAKQLLQVHDEIVFLVKDKYVKSESKKIKKYMQNPFGYFEHIVPFEMTVDGGSGQDWSSAK